MSNVIIYTKEQCPYCHLAKDLLTRHQVAFQEIRIDLDEAKRDEMIQKSGQRTVPQIFINNQPIGGYDNLSALASTGKLDDLLK